MEFIQASFQDPIKTIMDLVSSRNGNRSVSLSLSFSSKFSDSDASLDNVVSVRCMPWRSTCRRHHGPRGMWRLDIVS